MLVGISGTATGRAAKLDNLDALISSRATAADVWAYSSRTLTGRAAIFATITPSDTIQVNNDTERSTTSESWVKLKELNMKGLSGTVRTYFELRSGTGYAAFARIYKNGSAFGTSRSTSSTTYVAYTEDLSFAQDDLYQIYAYTANSASAAYVRYQEIRGDVATYEGPLITSGY
jgi:hypothetical protein